jgi:glyceraldehyde 3-phosphate dehydrogenase
MATSTKKGKKIKVAINGFGRIGKAVFKLVLEKENMEVVAINDLTDNKTLAHLLKYDSVYGVYDKKITATTKSIKVDELDIPVFSERDPQDLPWGELGVDVVLECTGHFVKDGAYEAHFKAGAKKVILSAPSKGEKPAPTYLIGVNEEKYKGEKVVSNASCTTNSIAHVTHILNEAFGVKKAFLTTIHSYTGDQNIVDAPHGDLRRARAGAHNIIPTTTGATIAVTKIIPSLKGKFDGMAVRVPTICGSLSDLTFDLKKKTTIEEVNALFEKKSKNKKLKNVFSVTHDPVVSNDILRNPSSSIVDLLSTKVIGGTMLKVATWYDNEWGYSNRMVDMIEMVSKK